MRGSGGKCLRKRIRSFRWDSNDQLFLVGRRQRHEATEKAIAAFEKKYPNIKVNAEYGAWNGWEQKQSLNLSGGNGADVMQINWNWITSFSSDGSAFYDLNKLSDILDLTQFSQGYLDQCTVAGKLQGVPISMTGRIFYWNKTTYEKAGLRRPRRWRI